MNNDYEELFRELNLNLKDNSQQHDMAALLGSLGVSPKYMNMYMDSIKKINEFKSSYQGRGYDRIELSCSDRST